MNKIEAWSLSRLQAYEECPLKFKWTYIDKRPVEKSEALENGILIHKLFENYLKGKIYGMPRQLTKLQSLIRNLKAANPIAEGKRTFGRDWNFIGIGDEHWFGDHIWLRMIYDAEVPSARLLVDLKTGRHYDKYSDQADLFALGAFIEHPDWEDVTVEMWYSKTGMVYTYELKADDQKNRIEHWKERAERMFSATKWDPTPHKYCKYCQWREECPAYES